MEALILAAVFVVFITVLFGAVYFNIQDGPPGGKQGGEY